METQQRRRKFRRFIKGLCFRSSDKDGLPTGSKAVQLSEMEIVKEKEGEKSTPESAQLLSATARNALSTAKISDTHAPPAKVSSKFESAAVPVPISPLPEEQLNTSDTGKMMQTCDELSKEATPVGLPTQDLWNEAYDDLRVKEEALVKDYEDTLSLHLKRKAGSIATISNFNIDRKKQMEEFLREQMEETNKNTWKLKFGGKDVPVKDLIQNVAGILDWANQYINGAVSANPFASIAWAGVGLLLPVCYIPIIPSTTRLP
jgi:muconolactone delta-isomerase